MRLVFRKDLGECIEGEVEAEPLRSEGELVLAGLVLMVAVLLTASELKRDLGLPACLAALVITAIVSIKNKSNPLKLAKEISWGTLVLVAGLFVMVDAVESIGALKLAQGWLAAAQRLAPAVAAMVVGFVVAIANNLVNNLTAWSDCGRLFTDIYYQEVLNNLAIIGRRSFALTYFSDPQTSRTSVQQSTTADYGIFADLITSAPNGVLTLFNRYLLDRQSASVSATQRNSGEWQH